MDRRALIARCAAAVRHDYERSIELARMHVVISKRPPEPPPVADYEEQLRRERKRRQRRERHLRRKSGALG